MHALYRKKVDDYTEAKQLESQITKEYKSGMFSNARQTQVWKK